MWIFGTNVKESDETSYKNNDLLMRQTGFFLLWCMQLQQLLLQPFLFFSFRVPDESFLYQPIILFTLLLQKRSANVAIRASPKKKRNKRLGLSEIKLKYRDELWENNYLVFVLQVFNWVWHFFFNAKLSLHPKNRKDRLLSSANLIVLWRWHICLKPLLLLTYDLILR